MNIGDTAKLNTNPEDSPETILRLFVYGTLKRGYWNHQRFCAQARSVEPAVVWGRLYHLHAGFPALEVPEGLILARGTSDPLTDARRQQKIGTPRPKIMTLPGLRRRNIHSLERDAGLLRRDTGGREARVIMHSQIITKPENRTHIDSLMLMLTARNAAPALPDLKARGCCSGGHTPEKAWSFRLVSAARNS